MQTLTNFTPLFTLVGFLYVICGILWFFVDCTQNIDVPESANE